MPVHIIRRLLRLKETAGTFLPAQAVVDPAGAEPQREGAGLGIGLPLRTGRERSKRRRSCSVPPRPARALFSRGSWRAACGSSPSWARRLPSQDKPSNKQILVLGLDGAGKTSVLYSLATNHVKRNTVPTKGFNAVCVNTEETKMEFLEIGGSESLREYWKMYMPRVLLLIYVVDSADHERFPVAKTLLHQLVQNNSTLPVMILANKQDLADAYCITDIHDALALSEIGDERKIFLIGTHVAKEGLEISSGLKDTRELITQLVSEIL